MNTFLPRPWSKSAAPARGGRAAKLPLVRRLGFTLIELLVIMLIILTLVGFIIPAFAAWQEAGAKTQMASETLVAMQSSQTLRDRLRKRDADSGSPRLPGITYAGTAVFFDQTAGLIRFADNNQYAPKNPSGYIALDTVTLNGSDWNKIPYDLLGAIDPVRIRPGVGIAGVVMTATGVKLQAMPFAVCCGPDNYGLPPAPAVFCDLAGTGNPQQIPTVAPAVIVFLRADIVKMGADPDDLSTLPGNSDGAKLNALLTEGRGMLVELAPQNGTAVDF